MPKAVKPPANANAKSKVPESDLEDLIKQMADTLELMLECEGLTWEAEHEAEILIARARKRPS